MVGFVMTLEELRAQLDALGIPHDKWGPGGGKTVQSPMLERHKAMLIKIRDLLAKQIEEDKSRASELHALLQRTKHGGGS